MKKRIIAAALTAVILLCTVPFSLTAGASNWGEGDTLESALSQLRVGFHETRLDWLVLPNLGVIYQRYSYFQYKNDRTGQIEEHPVYCIDPTKGGAYEVVRDVGPASDGSRTATYIRGERVGDYRYRTIMSCGFPHNRVESLGLQTEEEAYYATKVALWLYIRGNNPASLTINPIYGNNDPVALRVRSAAVNIFNGGMNEWITPTPNLTLTGNPNAVSILDAAGEYYVQRVEVAASGWVGTNPSASGAVQLSWVSPPPPGTIVLGSTGEDITSTLAVTTQPQKGIPKGMFTIKYPASAIDADTFVPPTIRAEAVVPNDEVYIAYAEVNRDRYQRYLVEADPKAVVTASFVSQISLPLEGEIPSDTGLRIRKLQTGTNIPLEGAVFEVRNPEGKLIYSLATNAGGIIDIPLASSGNYTVTEVSPPIYHLPPTVQTQSVWVPYGDTAVVTFTNAPYGALRVMKRDAAHGMPLGGAAVRIRNITTNTTQTRHTDSSGNAVFDRLPVGAYEIVEITSPEGYALDSTVHTVNVVPLSEGETSYTLTNKANPGLRIIKFDRQTMRPIAGVTFEVWRDGELIGNFITNDWGEISLYNMAAGTYTAKEISTVEPYVLDPTVQWIELKAGQGYISELYFFNIAKPGMWIVKIDSVTFAPLPNARFQISQVGGSFSNEFTTNANGEIDLSALTPGAYSVTELTAPNGYLIDNAVRTVQLNPGENAQFVFTNTRKPSLEVVKFDGENYLPGAIFRIAKIEDGSHYLDRITDISGRIRIDDLEPGIYSVKEVQPPPGYILNDHEYHVALFPSRTSQVVVPNFPKPKLRILKVDMVTGEPLANAEFRVSKVEGGTVGEYITDASGEILIENLDAAIYKVEEFMAPDGYLRMDEFKIIQLEPGRTSTLKFDNIRKPTLILTKTSATTFRPIPNTTYRIERESPDGGVFLIGTYRTDSNGQIILRNVEPGWYILTETHAAPGYAPGSNPVTRINLKPGENAYVNLNSPGETGGGNTGGNSGGSSGGDTSGNNILVTSGNDYIRGEEILNYPLNSIVIRKTHAVTGELLAGAAFELRQVSESISGTSGTIIGRYTTDNSGTIVISGLIPGGYIVTEVQAPANFLLTENSQQQTWLKPDGTSIVEVTFANYPYGGILITKTDAQTGRPLAGAKFRVTDSSGAVVGNSNGIYISNETGEIMIPNVKPGSYVVTEIEAPRNYTIDSTPQTINVGTDGRIYRLSFRNQPDGGLTIIKLNSVTRQPVQGAEFAVSKIDGERVGTYRTDRQGYIFLATLEPGWYVVSEVKAATGYILDAEPRNVEIKNGRATVVEVLNMPMTGLRLTKIDSVTKRPIYNVEFMLFDSNNRVVRTMYTDNNGRIDFFDNIPEGRYTIRETRAAPGYYRDDVPRTIELESGRVTEVRWENTPEMAQIQIIKKSGDDNEVNGFPAGTPLAGAIFEAYEYRSGNMVDRFVSGADGKAVSRPLPLGRYVVKEVQAPEWYRLSSQTLDLVLEFATQIVKMDFLNYSANTGVTIRKTGPAETMPGDIIRYDVRMVRNDSTVQLTDFFWRDTLPVDAVRLTRIVTGTYNQSLSYKVMATTNRGDTRVIADNLSSTRNNVIDCSNAALGLRSDEFITSFTFMFGTVKAGFAQVEQPQVYVRVLDTLPNQYQFANKADVGGKYGREWVVGNSTCVTTVYKKPEPLPRTGW